MSLFLILVLPFLGSLCAALLPANARNAEAWLAGAVTLSVCGLILHQLPALEAGNVLHFALPWSPTLNIAFQLRMDGFAWLFALLVALIGLLVVFYARYYMSPEDPVPRFFAFLLAFMGAMLGIVLSGNLLQLAMFWELTSLASFMLIAYWHHRQDARSGARMALTVTGMGGLAMLGGMLLIGHIVGSYELDAVFAAAEKIKTHDWYPAIVCLIALGALTKSAQFPFHFWLPHAMAAPTPVSAYLHSATMVKAGVFLLARLWPVLAGSDVWFWLIGGAGLFTLLLGGYLALLQDDLKGVLAYSTVSHLGLITLLLGMNSALALVAAVFHIVNHATFKASLFMAVGIIDHETGSRDIRRLSGLRHAMPLTASLAAVAAAAMAGVPLLNGFLSKEMFFAETIFLDRPQWQRILLPVAATLAGTFSVAYALRFIHGTFFGPPAKDLPRPAHDPNRWMLLPSAVLVAACLLVGIFPATTLGPYLRLASDALLGSAAPSYNLALWHGAQLPLLMSAIATLGGIALYFVLWRSPARRWPSLRRFDGKALFEASLRLTTQLATQLLARLSSQRLQTQLALIFLASLAAAFVFRSEPLRLGTALAERPPNSTDAIFALIWVIGASAALGAAWLAKHQRLGALILSGGAGLATCLTFVWFSAPDLALTQLAVEIVTVILILLGLRWLPRGNPYFAGPAPLRIRLRRSRDALIATAGGASIAALAYAILSRPAPRQLADFFTGNAVPLGDGQNVVNVILVDFRGFDTFGEITVLAIVALSIYALLRRFRPAPESMAIPVQQRAQDEADTNAEAALSASLPAGYLMLPAVLVRLLLPMAVLVSLYFLLRGHNAPGGGFVGGLIFATTIILQYIVGGIGWLEARLRIRPLYWIAGGLLAAAGAGLLALVQGAAFLQAQRWHGSLPFLGEIHLSSVLLFDIGVYLLVVGATVLILIALGHQSLRSRPNPVPAT
ncbi:monovalent cation/H+ antiporter subunit A [Azonexus sp.]|uniref:monovalent cation/H+ antiporter subunit A n=1 Tax=Azonexus sp. TaxID=1872668 RepID=UPI0039E3CFC8